MEHSHTGILYKKENEQSIAFCNSMDESLLQNWKYEAKATRLCIVQVHGYQVQHQAKIIYDVESER